jgi:predicted dehydrogenase
MHPKVDVVAVCDTSKYLLDILEKNAGLRGFVSSEEMLDQVKPDALIIATPSHYHAQLVRSAIEKKVHVFCEKPFCIDPIESAELAALAESAELVNQVGYHYRFVAAFQEMKRLLDVGAIGTVTHVLAEAYGPVVLRRQGISWRSKPSQGGGCLYDYAAHPVNILNWCFGNVERVDGAVLNSIFSKEIDDEVYCTMRLGNNVSAQLSANWSDESVRKMTVKITAWGTGGRIFSDRQECQVFLRDRPDPPVGYTAGWNVRYTTELTEPVRYYVRGEEYSAQLDHFVDCIESRERPRMNSFASAAETDRVLSMIRDNANQKEPLTKPRKRFPFSR